MNPGFWASACYKMILAMLIIKLLPCTPNSRPLQNSLPLYFITIALRLEATVVNNLMAETTLSIYLLFSICTASCTGVKI